MEAYSDILALRSNLDDVDRGYKFEQLIREIQPWDRKPPIAISLSSEQLDGIFVWKERPYLIESKAKLEPITPGSHDWEDFELKVRKRKNSIVALFCSLFEVSERVYQSAELLNREGFAVIVLAGKFWDEINKYQLPIKDVLEYMNLFGRMKFSAKPPEVKQMVDWLYDKEDTQEKLASFCKKNSATFMRRYKSPLHDDLYIYRDIDQQIESYSYALRPLALQKTKKKQPKEKPRQICLVRDYSGSGKTTLSLQLASHQFNYLGTGIAANEENIDEKFESFFRTLGETFGIRELIALNRPFVFVIDSLDEASSDINKKKKELLAIFRYIDELNQTAKQYNLLAYPVLVIFTVREDYWRNWESIFEGRWKNDIRKRISQFSHSELSKALEVYSRRYEYRIISGVSADLRTVLAIPINLLIFSETYQYQGDISIDEIWEGKVIDTYFIRKSDDIYKRYISGLTGKILIDLISLFAFEFVRLRNFIIHQNTIENLIEVNFNFLFPYSDEIINALISEQILIRDTENPKYLRFRHSRFIEFLLAYYIVRSIERGQSLKRLDYFAQVSFESGVVMMFRVHDDIRYIGKTKFPQVLTLIDSYYSQSNYFMSRKLLSLRSDLATGRRTEKDDLAFILKNVNRNDPSLIGDAYFVVAAKINSSDFFCRGIQRLQQSRRTI